MCGRIIKIPLHLWENLMKKKNYNYSGKTIHVNQYVHFSNFCQIKMNKKASSLKKIISIVVYTHFLVLFISNKGFLPFTYLPRSIFKKQQNIVETSNGRYLTRKNARFEKKMPLFLI